MGTIQKMQESKRVLDSFEKRTAGKSLQKRQISSVKGSSSTEKKGSDGALCPAIPGSFEANKAKTNKPQMDIMTRVQAIGMTFREAEATVQTTWQMMNHYLNQVPSAPGSSPQTLFESDVLKTEPCGMG